MITPYVPPPVDLTSNPAAKHELLLKLQKLLPLLAGVVQEAMFEVLKKKMHPAIPLFVPKLVEIFEDHGLVLEAFKINPEAVFLRVWGGPVLRIDLVAKGYDLHGTPVFHPTHDVWRQIPLCVWYVRYMIKSEHYESGPYTEDRADKVIQILKDPSFLTAPGQAAFRVAMVHKALRVGVCAPHTEVEASLKEVLGLLDASGDAQP